MLKQNSELVTQLKSKGISEKNFLKELEQIQIIETGRYYTKPPNSAGKHEARMGHNTEVTDHFIERRIGNI